MLADIQQAINIERKMNKSNKALKDIMARVVSDYNKMVSIKRHKIDGARRNLIYNLFLSQKKQSINESLDISQSLRVPCWRVVAGLSGCDFLKPAWTCCTSIMMAIVTNSQVGLGALGQNMFLDCFMVFSYKALCDYCWLPILVSECHCINPVRTTPWRADTWFFRSWFHHAERLWYLQGEGAVFHYLDNLPRDMCDLLQEGHWGRFCFVHFMFLIFYSWNWFGFYL